MTPSFRINYSTMERQLVLFFQEEGVLFLCVETWVGTLKTEYERAGCYMHRLVSTELGLSSPPIGWSIPDGANQYTGVAQPQPGLSG